MDALIMLAVWSGATILLMALSSRRRWASFAPSLRLYLMLVVAVAATEMAWADQGTAST